MLVTQFNAFVMDTFFNLNLQLVSAEILMGFSSQLMFGGLVSLDTLFLPGLSVNSRLRSRTLFQYKGFKAWNLDFISRALLLDQRPVFHLPITRFDRVLLHIGQLPGGAPISRVHTHLCSRSSPDLGSLCPTQWRSDSISEL